MLSVLWLFLCTGHYFIISKFNAVTDKIKEVKCHDLTEEPGYWYLKNIIWYNYELLYLEQHPDTTTAVFGTSEVDWSMCILFIRPTDSDPENQWTPITESQQNELIIFLC